jgi:hypothetical protein
VRIASLQRWLRLEDVAQGFQLWIDLAYDERSRIRNTNGPSELAEGGAWVAVATHAAAFMAPENARVLEMRRSGDQTMRQLFVTPPGLSLPSGTETGA